MASDGPRYPVKKTLPPSLIQCNTPKAVICGFKVKTLGAAQGWPLAPETFRGACLGSLLIKYYLWPAAVPGILLRKHCCLLLPKALPKCCYLQIQSKNILGRSGWLPVPEIFRKAWGGPLLFMVYVWLAAAPKIRSKIQCRLGYFDART